MATNDVHEMAVVCRQDGAHATCGRTHRWDFSAAEAKLPQRRRLVAEPRPQPRCERRREERVRPNDYRPRHCKSAKQRGSAEPE